MTTLLRIDASVRRAGSASRAIADQLQASWRRARDGRVIARDLAAAPPPHLDEAAVAGLFAMPGGSAAISDELIGELRAATDLLISTPMYNFGIPSTLKAWFDHVVRAGHTFEQRDGAYHPLLAGRTAYVVIARGGVPRPGVADNLALPYLRLVLPFLGWRRLEVIEIPGMALPEPERRPYLDAAAAAVIELFRAGER